MEMDVRETAESFTADEIKAAVAAEKEARKAKRKLNKAMKEAKESLKADKDDAFTWKHCELTQTLNSYVCDLGLIDYYWPYISEINYIGEIITYKKWPKEVGDKIARVIQEKNLKMGMQTNNWQTPKKTLKQLVKEVEETRLEIIRLTRKRFLLNRMVEQKEADIEAALELERQAEVALKEVGSICGYKTKIKSCMLP
jgi:hypothetical protein